MVWLARVEQGDQRPRIDDGRHRPYCRRGKTHAIAKVIDLAGARESARSRGLTPRWCAWPKGAPDTKKGGPRIALIARFLLLFF